MFRVLIALFISCITSAALAQQIQQLPNATMPLTGSEYIPMNQAHGINYQTVKATSASIGALGQSCITRAIASSASDTATANDCQIFWNANVTSNKAQSIPPCNTQYANKTFWITDEIQTASIYPITITPSSGTINNGANIQIQISGMGVILRCNSTTSNWVVQ